MLLSFILGILFGSILIYMLLVVKDKCLFLPSSGRDMLFKNINQITRQMARYLIAAENDKDIMIAYSHMSYGIGYMWSLEEIASDSVISDAINNDYRIIKKNALQIQDSIITRMMSACPHLIPKTREELVKLARGLS